MLKALQNTMYQAIKKCGQKFNLDLPYLIRNGFLVIVRQGVVIAFGLVLSIAFARLVPQEVFGQYQFVLSVLAIVSVVSNAFSNIFFYLKSLRYVENDKKGDAIHYGWFLTRINVLSMFADNLDKVVIGIFLGPEALAVYFLGITLTRTIFGLSKTVTSVLLPKIAMRK